MRWPQLGPRLCAAWVRWYTRRLPVEIAEQRRDELASDLWEHADDAARAGRGRLTYDIAVIRRVLVGMPADVSWRRAVLRTQPALDDSPRLHARRVGAIANYTVVHIGPVAVMFGSSSLLVLATTARDVTSDEATQLLAGTVLAGILFIGLLLRTSMPLLSTLLMVVGAWSLVFAESWDVLGYAYGVVITAAAITSASYRSSDTSFTWRTADGSPVVIVVPPVPTAESIRRGALVEIRSDKPNARYREVGHVEAVCTIGMAFSRRPDIADVNARLGVNAAERGANAVIDVRYRRGPTLRAWQELKASGTAVVIASTSDAPSLCPSAT